MDNEERVLRTLARIDRNLASILERLGGEPERAEADVSDRVSAADTALEHQLEHVGVNASSLHEHFDRESQPVHLVPPR